MVFPTKTSLKFYTFNALRVLSVVAILLALAGSIVSLVSDMKGYKSYEDPASSTSSPASSFSTKLIVRKFDSGVGPEHRMIRKKREYIGVLSEYPVLGHTTYTSHSMITATASSAAAIAKATATLERSSTTSTSSSSSTSSYIDGTSVPRAIGGVVFVAANRIFVCLILILAFFAEVPPATHWTQRLWKFAFPPFGAKFGTAVLGLVQVFLGSDILAKTTTGFAQVGAWLLFIVGSLNLLFGLIFGARLKDDRAFVATAAEPKLGGLRSLVLGAQAHAGASPAAGSTKYEAEPKAYERGAGVEGSAVSGAPKKKGRRVKPIVISPPMSQAPAPPVYLPAGRY